MKCTEKHHLIKIFLLKMACNVFLSCWVLHTFSTVCLIYINRFSSECRYSFHLFFAFSHHITGLCLFRLWKKAFIYSWHTNMKAQAKANLRNPYVHVMSPSNSKEKHSEWAVIVQSNYGWCLP